MRKSTMGGIIALLLAGIVTITAGIGSAVNGKWFKNPDITTWFNSWGKDGEKTRPDKPNIPDDGNNENDPSTSGGSEIGEIVENGISLLTAVIPREAYAANGVSERAENAYTITAEVTPDYASDKSLNWSVSWLNKDSAFANGKTVTDYVTITPARDGANTAVCACLKDFSEPIVITVKSRSNPEVSGICYVQYYQRVKSCDYVFRYDGAEVSVNNSNNVYMVDYTGAKDNYTVELKPVYSNYTLTDTYTTSITGSFSSAFGYTATESLNTIKIPAGMAGGDPEMSTNVINWCQYVYTLIFGKTYTNTNQINADGPNRGLCLGTYGNPTYRLSAEEKLHPRCAYYISLISDNSNFSSVSAFEQAKVKYNNYRPAAYNYCGAQIPSYNDFVTAVKRCNSGKVGVIQYTISIVGEHSSYSSVLNLGYNDEFKINVQDINMSDTEIAF